MPSSLTISFLVVVGGILAGVLIFCRFCKGSVANSEQEQPVERNIVRIKDAMKARSRSKPAKCDTTGVEIVTDATFEKKVLAGSKNYPVLVDFYATWCGPCRTLAPLLEQIAQQPEYKGRIHFTKMDVDQNRITASRHNVRSMPTLIMFEFGRERRRITGLQLPGILAMLNNSIGHY